MRLYLTDDEVAEICEPLVNAAAQYKYITSKLGMHAGKKPNGRPLVARSEFERVMGADRLQSLPAPALVDVSALRKRWESKNGKEAQRR